MASIIKPFPETDEEPLYPSSDGEPVGENQDGGARRAQDIPTGNAEKDVAHMHDARITQHPIEPLLRDPCVVSSSTGDRNRDSEPLIPAGSRARSGARPRRPERGRPPPA